MRLYSALFAGICPNLGVEDDQRIFNGLLGACARDRNHRKVRISPVIPDPELGTTAFFYVEC